MMGQAVISIIYTQTGSRTGELLKARALTVYFGESEGKIVVTIWPNGAKMDGCNQRSSPIVFTELQDLCYNCKT